MKEAALPNLPVQGGAPAVEAEGLSFTYQDQDAERPALRGLSFRQGRGETIGIMGASGAGKSTLAKCLNRIIPEFERGEFGGTVRIGGRSIEGSRVCDVAARVGMVFQDFEAQLFSTNVAHEVAFAMEQLGVDGREIAARIGPALQAVGLAGFERRDPNSLSGGEKQRLAIAAVLALSPEIIVLDEPTTDLDPQARAALFDLIRRLRERALSMIVIEHEAEELRDCDRLILIREGTVIADSTPADLLVELELLEECGVRPPGLNRVLAQLGLKTHVHSVEEGEQTIRRLFPRLRVSEPIANDKASPALVDPENSSGQSQVEIQNVGFYYPEGPPVLDSVSLKIQPGEFIAIIGQNGSGKTTLAKLLVGLLKPTQGRILLGGRDRAAMRPADTVQEVGYVFQNPDHQIFAATVEEEVAFGPRNFNLSATEIEQRCAEVLEAVSLSQARARDPFLLSKGERQRVAVASILALRPRLLILDEPTTGLDYREQRRMMSLVTELNQAGITIVIITHTPWLVAEYARRVVLMAKGRNVFDGSVREFFSQPEVLSASSFRPPDVTALGWRFGVTALTADELAGWLSAQS